jgi:hypothetical protein
MLIVNNEQLLQYIPEVRNIRTGTVKILHKTTQTETLL